MKPGFLWRRGPILWTKVWDQRNVPSSIRNDLATRASPDVEPWLTSSFPAPPGRNRGTGQERRPTRRAARRVVPVAGAARSEGRSGGPGVTVSGQAEGFGGAHTIAEPLLPFPASSRPVHQTGRVQS